MYFGSANRLMPVPLDASWSFLSNQICNRNGHISEIKTKKTPWWVSAKTFMVHFHWFTFSIILSMFINILKMIKVTKQQMVVFETTKSQSRSVFFQLPTSDNYGVVRHASSPWPFSWRPAHCCAVTLGETGMEQRDSHVSRFPWSLRDLHSLSLRDFKTLQGFPVSTEQKCKRGRAM